MKASAPTFLADERGARIATFDMRGLRTGNYASTQDGSASISLGRQVKEFLTCILNDKAGSGGAASAGPINSRMADQRGWEARIVACAGGDELRSQAVRALAAGGLVVG